MSGTDIAYAARRRLLLMPVDTCKTTLQEERGMMLMSFVTWGKRKSVQLTLEVVRAYMSLTYAGAGQRRDEDSDGKSAEARRR
eukprot:3647653-Rhodomonas_salina.2